jgi:hypothetical protein
MAMRIRVLAVTKESKGRVEDRCIRCMAHGIQLLFITVTTIS